MTKYLTVTYYPTLEHATLADRYYDGNGTPGNNISVAFDSKIMFDSSFGSDNIDLGDYDCFRGTYDEFNKSVINELAQYYQNQNGMTYSAIGRLLIILDNFPEDYNYIVIDNRVDFY